MRKKGNKMEPHQETVASAWTGKKELGRGGYTEREREKRTGDFPQNQFLPQNEIPLSRLTL